MVRLDEGFILRLDGGQGVQVIEIAFHDAISFRDVVWGEGLRSACRCGIMSLTFGGQVTGWPPRRVERA